MTEDQSESTRAFDIPIALFAFNRPEKTKKVLHEILKQSPRKLYLVMDGARKENENDQSARKEILGLVESALKDHPKVELIKEVSNQNLGCKKRISSGIDFVFEREKWAIFLEDDCLPAPSFFSYCEELLEHYETNPSIGLIAGYNPLSNEQDQKESFYFSHYPHIWGWATWKRVWNLYDVSMKEFPKIGDQIIKKYSKHSEETAFWKSHFENVYNGEIDTWDAQITYMCFQHDLLTAIPVKNQIENIGLDHSGTHTHKALNYQENASQTLEFPLLYPESESPEAELENLRSRVEYRKLGIHKKILRKLGLYK
ncbi:MAG: glycosyltransferase family 2 protein [Bacteriovoracaceae bacterium]